jgi:hypothetical protein
MPRFFSEGTIQENVLPVSGVDMEQTQPTRRPWYRWHRNSGTHAKSEKKASSAEEIDYVEEVDGVWGKLGEGTPNYKNVGW